MEKQKKVTDASVLIKWFLNEKGREEALKLRAEYLNEEVLIIVPEIIFLEILNALRYKEKGEQELKDVARALIDYQFNVEPLSEFLLDKAIHLSVKNNLTIYDAVYAALAGINACPLVTADKELSKLPNSVLL